MTKDDWTARVSLRVSASDRARCPTCTFEQPRTEEIAYCPDHGHALIEVRFLGSAQESTLGRILAERFVLLERLGSGATGSVYRARDLLRQMDVALKLVPAKSPFFGETRLRFEREAEAMKVLESPHSVRIFESGETSDGSCFLAMELLYGETLGARLKRGPLEPASAVRIAEGALKSLAEAHSKGIVHRDLKPDNLFIVSDIPGRPDFCKVLDFGIAKLSGPTPFQPGLTERGTVLGTPRYMSPEQAQGAPIDSRSDLYSLGVILFQMLTGAPPFVAPDPVLVMAKHVRELPPSLTEIAPHLASLPKLVALVRKVLAKSADDRPQTAGEMLRQFEDVRRELGLVLPSTTTSGGVSLAPSAVRRRSSNLAWYLSLGAACLGFIGIGWIAKGAASGTRAGARPAAAPVEVQAEASLPKPPAPVPAAQAPAAAVEPLRTSPVASVAPSGTSPERAPSPPEVASVRVQSSKSAPVPIRTTGHPVRPNASTTTEDTLLERK